MKKLIAVLVGMFTFGLVGVVSATPAYEFTSTPGAAHSTADWIIGQKFTVGVEDIVVDSLGFYDARGDGLLFDHEMGLFDIATKTLLASTTVTTNDVLVDHFRWSNIDTVILNAGEQYVVVGANPGYEEYNVIPNNYNTDSRITANGYMCESGTLTLGVPTGSYEAYNYLLATNFNIQDSSPQPVPEPCTMLLLGSGLAGLVGLRRKNSKK